MSPSASPPLPPTASARPDDVPDGWRAAAWAGALLLVLGSALFLAGGRLHPAIGAASGTTPEMFFRAFAEKVHHTDGWRAIHMLILLGPIAWALGAPMLLEALRPDARLLVSAARSALLISAMLWAVAFVLDGFGAPVYAQAMLTSSVPQDVPGVLTSFAATAVMMSRLGLVSWVVGGLGIVALAAVLLARRDRTTWRVLTGVTGVILGAWPLLAALEGEYAGGPFTSRYWMPNALTVGLWFVGLAGCALSRPHEGR